MLLLIIKFVTWWKNNFVIMHVWIFVCLYLCMNLLNYLFMLHSCALILLLLPLQKKTKFFILPLQPLLLTFYSYVSTTLNFLKLYQTFYDSIKKIFLTLLKMTRMKFHFQKWWLPNFKNVAQKTSFEICMFVIFEINKFVFHCNYCKNWMLF